MELKQLRYFLGVCEHGSIAEAARLMHIAQPALSRQISSLEDDLGVKLFTRLPRGVALTRSGEELQRRALDILDRSQALSSHVKVASQGMTGTLRIGVLPGYSWLPQLTLTVKLLQQSAPSVHISIETMHSAEQLERVRCHDLDMGIVGWRSPFEAAFGGVSFLTDPMALVLPSSWPEAQQAKPPHLRELAGRPLLMFPRERSSRNYDTVVQALANVGIRQKHFQVTIADAQTMIGMVAAGLGYAIAPLSFQSQWSPLVTFRMAEGLDISITLELVWRLPDSDPLVGHFLRLWPMSKDIDLQQTLTL